MYVCLHALSHALAASTPNPPIKSFPIKGPWVKLSGRPPIKVHGHDNSNP